MISLGLSKKWKDLNTLNLATMKGKNEIPKDDSPSQWKLNVPNNRRPKKGSPIYSLGGFNIVFEKILFSFDKRVILFQDL